MCCEDWASEGSLVTAVPVEDFSGVSGRGVVGVERQKVAPISLLLADQSGVELGLELRVKVSFLPPWTRVRSPLAADVGHIVSLCAKTAASLCFWTLLAGSSQGRSLAGMEDPNHAPLVH